MPEQRGGFGGFVDRIISRGKAVKPAVVIPSVSQAADQQRIALELETARENARLMAEQNARATAIDQNLQQRLIEGGYPQSNIDIQTEVNRIESSVTARAVHGKFHPGVVMKGRVLNKDYQDWKLYGDIEKFKYPVSQQTPLGEQNFLLPFRVFSYTLYKTFGDAYLSEFEKEMQGKTFIAVSNDPNQKDVVLAYNCPSSYRDEARRAVYRVEVFFKLPKEEAYKLLTLIRKNPQVSEDFLKKAAEGADVDPNDRTKPSIQRVPPQDELIIVNLDRFNSNHFNPYAKFINKPNPYPTFSYNDPQVLTDMEKMLMERSKGFLFQGMPKRR